MTEHTEKRWAVWNHKAKYFCGKHCWSPAGSCNAPNTTAIPTFRTRKLARQAIERMTSCSNEARPVRVAVTITTT